jgi:hypothetical protein
VQTPFVTEELIREKAKEIEKHVKNKNTKEAQPKQNIRRKRKKKGKRKKREKIKLKRRKKTKKSVDGIEKHSAVEEVNKVSDENMHRTKRSDKEDGYQLSEEYDSLDDDDVKVRNEDEMKESDDFDFDSDSDSSSNLDSEEDDTSVEDKDERSGRDLVYERMKMRTGNFPMRGKVNNLSPENAGEIN